MDEMEIKRAYGLLTPGQRQKERMLSNIVTQYDRRTRGWVPMEEKRRSWKAVPALLSLLLILCAAGFGWACISDPFLLAPEPVRELVEDPYYQACMEWYDYVIGMSSEKQVERDWGYLRYGCQNYEMRDALQDFSRKHGLELLSQQKEYGTDFFDYMTENFGVMLPLRGKESYLEGYVNCWFVDEKLWRFSASINQTGKRIFYTFCNVSKDRFDYEFWRMGPLENYEFWTHATSQGEKLVMAVDQKRAYLIRNGEQSLSYIWIEYAEQGDGGMSKSELEEFAEIFDFSGLQ